MDDALKLFLFIMLALLVLVIVTPGGNFNPKPHAPIDPDEPVNNQETETIDIQPAKWANIPRFDSALRLMMPQGGTQMGAGW